MVMLKFVHRYGAWTAIRCHFRLHLPPKHLTASIHTSKTFAARTLPELTSVRYPNITRGDFACLSTADIDFFKKMLNDPGQVLTEDDDLISYNVDWMGNYRGTIHVYLFITTKFSKRMKVSNAIHHAGDDRDIERLQTARNVKAAYVYFYRASYAQRGIPAGRPLAVHPVSATR